MHETFISKAILNHVDKSIRCLGKAVLVEKVFIRVGEFTNVDPESLRFTFDSMKSRYMFCRSSSLQLSKLTRESI